MKKLLRSKKGMEMTMGIIVAIVIGLVILAVLIYMFVSKGKGFSSSTSCPEAKCATAESQCTSQGEKWSFTPCKKGEESGRCCVPDPFS